MTEVELAELERLLSAVKLPDEWAFSDDEHACRDFILAARTALPALIAEVRRLRGRLAGATILLEMRLAEVQLLRVLRVCSNCKLVGRHVESCNACGGTEFEELKP